MRAVRPVIHLLGAWAVGAFLCRYLTSGVPLLDPFLVVTVYYALRSRPPGGTLMGLGAGLLQDALTGSLFGLNGFSKTLIGYMGHAFGGRLLLTNPIAQTIILVSCTLGDRLVVGSVGLVVRGSFHLPPPGALLLLCLFNAVAGLFLFRVADARDRRAALDGAY